MKAKEVAMVIALAILGALFVGLLVDAVYESPKYEDYCKTRYPEAHPKYVSPTVVCNYTAAPEEVDRVNKCYDEKGMPEFNFDQYGCQTGFKECNYCSKYFNDANNLYNRNVFYIVSVIGAIAILAGLYLRYDVVGTGMMFSGILLVAYGTARYFSEMSKIMRVVVIFIELALLIMVSIKKLKK